MYKLKVNGKSCMRPFKRVEDITLGHLLDTVGIPHDNTPHIVSLRMAEIESIEITKIIKKQLNIREPIAYNIQEITMTKNERDALAESVREYDNIGYEIIDCEK